MKEVNVTEFWSDDRTKTAEVVLVDGVPRVYMFLDEELLDAEDFPNNTLQYAADAAENYVLGIKKLNTEDAHD
jgi:hypothetical protein